MTYAQMWRAFNMTCPLRNVRDWRPFEQNKLIVWLHGNRRFKVVKVTMIDDFIFKIEPSSDEEWLRFEQQHEKDIPTIMDSADKKGA